jgi:ATP-dependent Clp protease adapter protein ClpS
VVEPPPQEQERSGGTGLLERPDLDRSQPSGEPRTESGIGAQNPSDQDKLGGGNYRVLLLDDPKHTEQLVVKVVPRVVPEVDELKARNLFETSRQLGQAIVTTALKEHAEFYASQIFRQGVRSTIEPDSTVM